MLIERMESIEVLFNISINNFYLTVSFRVYK